MIIEIRGTGTHNKGAELMACAIIQYFGRRIPGVRFVVEPRFGSYAARAKYGLLTKVQTKRLGRAKLAQALMSRSFRETYGLVRDPEIDAVLDASGFAFGDQWGPGPAEGLARQAERWQRRGTKAVLLPQAFGPFENVRVRSAFQKGLELVDAVYVRDRKSLEHVQALGGPAEKIRAAPDFTNIVSGACPADVDLPDRFACIAPNLRMVDRTTAAAGAAYIGFLVRTIRALRENHVVPVIVCHAGKDDIQVTQSIQRELGESLTIVREEDPVILKGIVGRSEALIGSRFHALVGALSQGVPAIGTSWSHKYEMLFEDYGCPEYLLNAAVAPQKLEALIRDVCDAHISSPLRAELRVRAAAIRLKVDQMLDEVTRLLIPEGALS